MNDFIEYVVKEGDTIISIAEDNNVRVIDLIELNNLEDVYRLTPGETIKIPVYNYGFQYYTVQKGDTLYAIANKFNIALDTLTEINGLEPGEYIYPNQKILVPKEGVNTYITKMGDTVLNLAEKLGLRDEDLILLNKHVYLLPDQLIAYRINKSA